MNKLIRFAPIMLAVAAPLLWWSDAEAQSAGLTTDPDAQLLNSNQVLVSGTVPCQSGATVYIYVTLSQGGTTGYGYSSVQCDAYGQVAYDVAAASFDGTFHKGKAHPIVTADVCSFFGCTPYFTARDVHVEE